MRRLDNLDFPFQGGPDITHTFTQQQVLNFVYFDIYCNDLFIYLNVVYKQIRGIAIGGTCLSQFACADCMISEYKYLETVPPFALQGPMLLHPCILPVRPGRFRDNCLGMKFVSTSFADLQSWLEGVYNVKFVNKSGYPPPMRSNFLSILFMAKRTRALIHRDLCTMANIS